MATKFMKCTVCVGTVNTYCPLCLGEGTIAIRSKERCPTCDGSGFERTEEELDQAALDEWLAALEALVRKTAALEKRAPVLSQAARRAAEGLQGPRSGQFVFEAEKCICKVCGGVFPVTQSLLCPNHYAAWKRAYHKTGIEVVTWSLRERNRLQVLTAPAAS